ncbi:MAG: lytic murein transglycosylase [Rhodospirillales bacterium]|nr:lytic murein transglycosylase [Rhodospirillales bacterium]MDH3912206.1 lytic murein transglycosylase [Rhodospirillales bacterium]MDH3919433.1 lytic murein transglycosylase [Rhodospirillales bacterium]MDH3970076.1 lytic murein transglycosylase [Rhodospirillales bacterium]
MRSRSFVLCLLAAVFGPQLAWAQDDFAVWLEEFKGEATAAGISPGTLASALDGVAPLEEIIELDRRQPEFTQTFWGYTDGRVTPQRVERGRKLLVQHRSLLNKIKARYGVQPGFLVAFWGLETNFGDFLGKTPVIASLVTLAYDRRRSDFFRNQLLDALRMVDGGHAKLADMKGSWAGAMGQLQFMPNTFIRYAVDGDGDGRRDIWRSYPDAFASAANYLRSIGWQPRERWGREVRLPQGFDLSLADLAVEKPLSEWRKLGVRRANGRKLPRAKMSGSIVLPGGAGGPAFLVYRNFRNIMVWNRSLLYALAVGYLSDRVIGLGQLRAKRPTGERPLRREEVEELQVLLAALGFDPGEPDGIVGSRTRAALRTYQQHANLPADGYPTIGLLEGLRQKSGN